MKRLLFTILMMLSIVGVGCGGSDSEDETPGGGATTAAASAAEESSSGGDDGSAAGGDVLAGDCADEAAIQGAFTAMGDVTKTPDQKRADFDRAIAYFDGKRSTVPAELSADFTLVHDYFKALQDVLESIDYDTDKLAENAQAASDFADLASEFDTAKLSVALGKVSRYVVENCD